MSRSLLWLILILEYGYIFGVLQNYDNAFMHPEKTLTHHWILENGPSFKLEDFKRGMNVRVLEWGAPRISRPFSNLFEVINAKFRIWLWHFVPPHPSLSLSWPLMFILFPVLFYYTLRNMNCEKEVSLAGVCLALSAAGFLCPMMMTFHPGKAFVTFFAVLSLFLASRLHKRVNIKMRCADAGKEHYSNVKPFLASYFMLLVVVYLSFFWDETGLFVYVLIFAMLARSLFFRSKPKFLILGIYLMLPLLYCLTLFYFLPHLHALWGSEGLNLKDFSATPPLSSLFLPNLTNLFWNVVYLFDDHIRLPLNPLQKYPGVGLGVLAVLYQVLFALFIGALILVLFKYVNKREKDNELRRLIFDMSIFAALLLAYAYFQTFIMSKVYYTSGVYWYGCLFSLTFSMLIALSLKLIFTFFRSKKMKLILPIIVATMVADSLVFTTYRQNVFKVSTSTFGFPLSDIFSGLKNQNDYFSFKQSIYQGRKKRDYTVNLWRSIKRNKSSAVLQEYQPAEESYIFLDLIKGMLSSEILRTETSLRNFILQPTQLFFQDINGDGKADTLYYDTTIRDRGFVHIGLSNGDRFSRFTKALEFWVEGNSRVDGSGKDAEKRMTFADINGDGRADALYFETWRSYTAWVSYGTVNGFSRPVTVLKYGVSVPEQLRYADVNGDRKADALYFDAGKSDGVWVSLSGTNGFTKAVQWIRYNRTSPEQIQYADVNGDGLSDALYMDISGQNGIWVSLSTGQNFTEPKQWGRFDKMIPEQIQYADVNGDGRVDALQFDRLGDKGIHVSLSTGQAFDTPLLWLQHGRFVPQQMRYADVDGDGKADALFVDPETFQIVICRSSGSQFDPMESQDVSSRLGD